MPFRDRRLAALALSLVLALGAACGGDDDTDQAPSGSSDEPVETTTSTTVPATTTTTEPVPDLGAIALSLTQVARLDQPLALAVRAGTQPLYVAEKRGRVRVLDDEPAAILDITREVATGNEQGLLGIAFSPDGAFLYVSYTNTEGDTRLDEFAMGAGARDIDLGSRRNVLAQDQPAGNHNGCNILFGPDGLLWFGLGDGGGGGDQFGNAQNFDTILGDIIRINPRPSGSAAYSTPPDNPFADGGGRREIALSGVRNPWRFSFDRATGDLWIGDVGQNAFEEVNRLPAGQILGANLGWPFLEGTHSFNDRTPPAGVAGPVHEYGRGDGRSVAGGFVYRGTRVPALRGAYVFADTYEGRLQLLAVHPDGTVDHRDTGIEVAGGLVSSFGEDAAGELYVMSLAGGMYRIDPA
jgi:glucose/arabinose dehydrogenase